MGGLDNKTAVVNGAGSGIGKATALLFAREGANVAGADLDVSDLPPHIKAVRCDVSSENDVKGLMRTASLAAAENTKQASAYHLAKHPLGRSIR